MATKHYKVGWDYRSSLGALTKGTTVELDDEFAALVNRDSPGILDEVDSAQQSKIEAAKKALAEATGQPTGDDSEPEGDDLDGLKKKELLALAAERGVEVSKKDNMDTIRAAIRAAQGDTEADDGDDGEDGADDTDGPETDGDSADTDEE